MNRAIPTIAQCLQIIDQYEMLDNIRAHSFKVAQVAQTILEGLDRPPCTQNTLPDRSMVMAGALLHDIAKTYCLKTDCHHAEEGKKICIELGYPHIGDLVAEHVVLRVFQEDLYQIGVFGEKEIVFYADKRVRHDQVVPLSARLEYIIDRYGDRNPAKEKLIKKNFSRTVTFENHLFRYLDFSPDDLEHHLVSDSFTKL